MPFPDGFLDELCARADIVDVVGRYVSLKRSGSGYLGLCPFHNEKTPSFSVSQDKQVYHCFGCGVGGGVINFLMRAENLDFQDAVHRLADMYNMPVPEKAANDELRARRMRVYALNRDAARFYHEMLLSPRGAQARQYFAARALSAKTVRNFGLGYVPDGWTNLLDEMTARGYTKSELLDAGLAVKNDKGGLYDRFRNRVMFPIVDVRGNVIGFGGRVLDSSLPKYLNSPDTIAFNKSRNLFALNLAKNSKMGRLILAEGYMDVIALHQAGIDCAVASLGTSLTEEQARLMTRYTKEVVICYDADSAGVKAAQRAIEILRRAGLEVKVLRIPGAKDPDEYIKANGAESFLGLLDRSESHLEYKLLNIKAKYALENDEDRVAYLKDAARLLAAVESPIEREIYAGRVSETARVPKEAMLQEIARERRAYANRQKREEKRGALAPERAFQPAERSLRYADTRSAVAEEGVIALAFKDADLLRAASEKLSPDRFSSEFLRRVYTILLERCENGRAISLSAMEDVLTPEESAHLTLILSRPVKHVNAKQELEDYIDRIQTQAIASSAQSEEDLLTLAARRHKEKKSYGEQ